MTDRDTDGCESGTIDDERDWDAEYERDRDRATEARLDREREAKMLDELPPTGGEEIPW